MLHAITLFRAFAVIETFQSADEIAGNPPNTLKADTLSDSLLHIFSSLFFQ